VIAVDTNILVYAHRKDSLFHEAAARCLRQLAEGRAAWAVAWPCVHEFLAIVTHPRIYAPPSTLQEALNQVDVWFESPSLVRLAESELHWSELRAAAIAAQVIGPRIHDARVVALCKQHGIRELWSADRDFGRFADLAVINPLVG
jgi:toxin-antitoxin system PIN domain toxin